MRPLRCGGVAGSTPRRRSPRRDPRRIRRTQGALRALDGDRRALVSSSSNPPTVSRSCTGRGGAATASPGRACRARPSILTADAAGTAWNSPWSRPPAAPDDRAPHPSLRRSAPALPPGQAVRRASPELDDGLVALVEPRERRGQGGGAAGEDEQESRRRSCPAYRRGPQLRPDRAEPRCADAERAWPGGLVDEHEPGGRSRGGRTRRCGQRASSRRTNSRIS